MTSPQTATQPATGHGSHHGRLTSWLVVALAILASLVGGGALIAQAIILFYVCVGVFLLCVPLGAVLGVMDDTSVWTAPEPGSLLVGGRELPPH